MDEELPQPYSNGQERTNGHHCDVLNEETHQEQQNANDNQYYAKYALHKMHFIV